MWNCRKCNAEIDDGFEVCWSCGTTIDGQEDPSFPGDADAPSAEPAGAVIATAEALVTVASPTVPEHAHVMRCHLEAAGIGVYVADEPASGFDWLLHRGSEPIHLQVPESEADRARAILAEIPAEETKPPAEEKSEPAPPTAEQPPPPAPAVPEPESQAPPSPQEQLRILESKLSSLMDEYDTPDWKVNPAFHPDVGAFIQAHAGNAAFLKKAQSMQQNRAKYFATMRQKAKEKAEAAARETAAAAPTEAAPDDAPMCTEVVEETPKPRVRLRVPKFVIRLTKWAVILLVLAVIGVFLAATTYRQMAEQELKEAIARIEEKDPNWRWEDLQAKRAQVPDKENAALKVLAVAKLLPDDWAADQLLEKEQWSLEPDMPLDAETRGRLQEVLSKYQTALVEARTLADFSLGRYPSEPGAGQFDWNRSHARASAAVRRLLYIDTALRSALDKDMDCSLASSRALLISGRSIGDEPGLVPQLCRKASRALACTAIERALAQGAGSDSALQTTEKLLQDDATRALLPLALRGERAQIEERCKRIESGELTSANAQRNSAVFDTGPFGPLQRWFGMSWLKENRALTLTLISDVVETANLPADQQFAALENLDRKCDKMRSEGWPEGRHFPAAATLSAVTTGALSLCRSDAHLRSTLVALAAERYRLAEGKWPDSLDALVPTYLPKVPADPYDGKPLRLRKLDDGLVIYSIGPDREDNQGTLDRKGNDPKGKDIGFRLWDVGRRRGTAK